MSNNKHITQVTDITKSKVYNDNNATLPIYHDQLRRYKSQRTVCTGCVDRSRRAPRAWRVSSKHQMYTDLKH